jgi:AcrR family transcriptional regulator
MFMTGGRREKGRIQNEAKIRAAASRLFREQGFDRTTIRQIAAAADLGLGTVYNYVADKHGLLDLISKDDLERVTREAFETMPTDVPVEDALMHVFRAIYAHHNQEPDLAFLIVKELTFAKDAKRTERENRFGEFNERLAALIGAAQRRGELGSHFHPGEVAMTLFGIHFFLLIVWLSGTLTYEQAVQSFQRALQLQLAGLKSRS